MDEESKQPLVKPGLSMITALIVALLCTLIFGALGYYFGKNAKTEAPAAPVAETAVIEETVTTDLSPAASSTASETISWKTYSNDTYGFSFTYPSDWTVSRNSPGASGAVKDKLELTGTDSEKFQLWINPDGFGFEGASDFYRAEILNGKIMISSKEPNLTETKGQVFTSPMTSNNISYVIAYDFDLNNRITELQKFNKIVATFQFTK